MKHTKPVVLVILDGFGYRKEGDFNAIFHAHTPHLTAWFARYPHTLLKASGSAVGLLDHQLSNSEVGHFTIGSGRVTLQSSARIDEAITNRSFFKNPALLEPLQRLGASGKSLHIMGLLSDAGVHSDIQQLYAYLDTAYQCGITHMYIHPFLDGRDTPPQSATTYLTQLSQELGKRTYGSIGSLQGRWYAMDRSSNWDRTEQSYKMLTSTQATPRLTWQEVLKTNYAAGITDEFIPPTRLDPNSTLGPGDGIIFINTRADRARQLTAAFVDPSFDKFPTQKLNLSFFMTPVFYGQHLATTILYPTKQLANTLKQVLAAADNTIFTIAETEKYAHVTYFFDGGSEQPVAHETRVLVPSLPLKDYSQAPCMSAPEITAAVIKSLTTNPCDFYLINYANADMVGHSGNFEATVAAIECLDTELQKLYALVVEKLDGTLIITADHGNAEEKWDKKHNQPRTAHTNNPVPFLVLSKHATPLPPLEGLADIAPYILQCMSLPIPAEMKK